MKKMNQINQGILREIESELASVRSQKQPEKPKPRRSQSKKSATKSKPKSAYNSKKVRKSSRKSAYNSKPERSRSRWSTNKSKKQRGGSRRSAYDSGSSNKRGFVRKSRSKQRSNSVRKPPPKPPKALTRKKEQRRFSHAATPDKKDPKPTAKTKRFSAASSKSRKKGKRGSTREKKKTNKIKQFMEDRGLQPDRKEDLMVLLRISRESVDKIEAKFKGTGKSEKENGQDRNWKSKKSEGQSLQSSFNRFVSVVNYDSTGKDIFKRNSESIMEQRGNVRADSAQRSTANGDSRASGEPPNGRRARRASNASKQKHSSNKTENVKLVPLASKLSSFKEYQNSVHMMAEAEKRNKKRKSAKFDPKKQFKKMEKRFQKHVFRKSGEEEDTGREEKSQAQATTEPSQEEFCFPVEDTADFDLREQLREILMRSEDLTREDKIIETEKLIAKMLASGKIESFRKQLSKRDRISSSWTKERQNVAGETLLSPRMTDPEQIQRRYDESHFVNHEIDPQNHFSPRGAKEKSGMSPETSKIERTGRYREIVFSNHPIKMSSGAESEKTDKEESAARGEEEMPRKTSIGAANENSFNAVDKTLRRDLYTFDEMDVKQLLEGEYTHAHEQKELSLDNNDVLVTESSEKDKFQKILGTGTLQFLDGLGRDEMPKKESFQKILGTGTLQFLDNLEVNGIGKGDKQGQGARQERPERGERQERETLENIAEMDKLSEEVMVIEDAKEDEEPEEEEGEGRDIKPQIQQTAKRGIKRKVPAKKHTGKERGRRRSSQSKKVESNLSSKSRNKMKKKTKRTRSIGARERKRSRKKSTKRAQSQERKKSPLNQKTKKKKITKPKPKVETGDEERKEGGGLISSSKLIDLKKKLYYASPAKVTKIERLLPKLENNNLVKYLCRKDFAHNEEEKFKMLIRKKPTMTDPFEELEKINQLRDQRNKAKQKDFDIEYNIHNLIDERVQRLIEKYKSPEKAGARNKATRQPFEKKHKEFGHRNPFSLKEQDHVREPNAKKREYKVDYDLGHREKKGDSRGNKLEQKNHEKCHTFYCRVGKECCHKGFDKTRFKSKKEASEYRKKRKEELMRQIEEVQNKKKTTEKKRVLESKPVKSFLNTIIRLTNEKNFNLFISRKSITGFPDSKNQTTESSESKGEERAKEESEKEPFAIDLEENDEQGSPLKGLGSQSIIEMISNFENTENQHNQEQVGSPEHNEAGHSASKESGQASEDPQSKLNPRAGITSIPIKNLLFHKKKKFATEKENKDRPSATPNPTQSLTGEDINDESRVKERHSKNRLKVFGTNSKRAKTKSKKMKRRPKNASVKTEKKAVMFPDLMVRFGEQRDSLPQEEEIRRKTLQNLRMIEQEKIREIARKFRQVAIGDGETDDDSFEEIQEETESSLKSLENQSPEPGKQSEGPKVQRKATELLGFNEYSTKKQSIGQGSPEAAQNSLHLDADLNSVFVEMGGSNDSCRSESSDQKQRTSVFRNVKNSIGEVFQRGRSFGIEPDSTIAISKPGAKAFYDKEKQQKLDHERNLKSKSVSDKTVATGAQNPQKRKEPEKNVISMRDNRLRAQTDHPGQAFTMNSGDSFGENNTITLDQSQPGKIEMSIPIGSDNSLGRLEQAQSAGMKSGGGSVLEMSLSEMESKLGGGVDPKNLMSPDNTFRRHFDGEGFRTEHGLISRIEDERDADDGDIEHFVNIETFESTGKKKDSPKFFPDSKRRLDPTNVTFQMENEEKKNESQAKAGKHGRDNQAEVKRKMTQDTDEIIEDAQKVGGIGSEDQMNRELMKNVNEAITEQILCPSNQTEFTGENNNKPARDNIASLDGDRRDAGAKTKSGQLEPKQFNSQRGNERRTSLGQKVSAGNTTNTLFQNDNTGVEAKTKRPRNGNAPEPFNRGLGSNIRPTILLSDLSKITAANKLENEFKSRKGARDKRDSGPEKSRRSRSVSQEKKKSMVLSEVVSFEAEKSDYQSRNRLTSLDGYFNHLGSRFSAIKAKEGKEVRKEIKMIKGMIDIKKLKDNLFKKKTGTNKSTPKKIGKLKVGVFEKQKTERAPRPGFEDETLKNKSNPIKERVEKQRLFESKEKAEVKDPAQKKELKQIEEEGDSLEAKKKKLEERLEELRKRGKSTAANQEIQELLLKLSQLEKNKQRSRLSISHLETEINRISQVQQENFFIKNDRKKRTSEVPRIKRQSTTKNKAVMKDFYRIEVTQRVSSKHTRSAKGPAEGSGPTPSGDRRGDSRKTEEHIQIYTTDETQTVADKKFGKYKTEPMKNNGEADSRRKRASQGPKAKAKKRSLWGTDPRKNPKKKRQRMEPFMKLSRGAKSRKDTLKNSRASRQSMTPSKRDSLIMKSREVLEKKDTYIKMKSQENSLLKMSNLKNSKEIHIPQMTTGDSKVSGRDKPGEPAPERETPRIKTNSFLKDPTMDQLPDLLELSGDQDYFDDNTVFVSPDVSNTITATAISDADYFNMSYPSKVSKSINSRRKHQGESVFGFSQKTGHQSNRNKADTKITDSYFDMM